jgi:hypothetical protein
MDKCIQARKGVRSQLLTTGTVFAKLTAMGRPHRAAEGGYVYHVLNRANARMPIFEDDGDYEAFEKVGGAKGDATR